MRAEENRTQIEEIQKRLNTVVAGIKVNLLFSLSNNHSLLSHTEFLLGRGYFRKSAEKQKRRDTFSYSMIFCSTELLRSEDSCFIEFSH